jgi:hypothetical protein
VLLISLAYPEHLVRYVVPVASAPTSRSGTPPGSGHARSALRFNGKIVALLRGGRLVVKLPAARVDALVGDRSGVRWDPTKRTPFKEWLSLDPQSELAWSALAREALEFARS